MDFDESKMPQALRQSTAQEWLKAFSSWSEVPDEAGNPVILFFRAQAALRIGDYDRGFQLLKSADQFLQSLKIVSDEVAKARNFMMEIPKGIPDESPNSPAYGRSLFKANKLLSALEFWRGVKGDRFLQEADFRLASIYYRLGEYELALQYCEKCVGGSFETRIRQVEERIREKLVLVDKVRVRSLAKLPNAFLRELTGRFVDDNSASLSRLAFFAQAVCAVTDDWDQFLVVLNRGFMKDDESAFEEVGRQNYNSLKNFLSSSRFKVASSPAFRDYVTRCCLRTGLYDLADAIITHDDPLKPVEIVRPADANSLRERAPELRTGRSKPAKNNAAKKTRPAATAKKAAKKKKSSK